MQEHCFEVRFTNIDRADLDATLIGFAHDRCENVFGLRCDDGYFVVGGPGFENIGHIFERVRKRIGIFVFADV